MKKNDIVELTVTGMTSEGDGVGRAGGMAVFVPAAAAGDRLSVRIIKTKSDYCYGRIERIIEPSPVRCESGCAVFPRCGGCRLRHINYAEELRVKAERIKNCFKKIAGIDVSLDSFASGKTSGYRNKAEYRFTNENGKIRSGFYARHSHRVVAGCVCDIQPDIFGKIAETVCETAGKLRLSVYDEQTHEGLLRALLIRAAAAAGEISVTIVINGDSLPGASAFITELKNLLGDRLAGLQININKGDTNVVLGEQCKPLYGRQYITDRLCGKTVRVSPLSFYQINRDMAETLYKKVAEYLMPEGKTVLDLYCGAGTIGLSMCDSAREIIGVETSAAAICDAKTNAKINGADNMLFIRGDAGAAVKELSKKSKAIDAAVIDPPRKGCGEPLLDILSDTIRPERIIYVSCNPATLARDCKHLFENGYLPAKISAADLFPRTPHVETVVLMSRM